MCHFLDASEERRRRVIFFFITTFHNMRGHGCLPTNRKRSDLFTNYTAVADVFAIHKHCQALMILIFIPGLSWEGNKQKTDKPFETPSNTAGSCRRRVSQWDKFSCSAKKKKKVCSKFLCCKQTLNFAQVCTEWTCEESTIKQNTWQMFDVTEAKWKSSWRINFWNGCKNYQKFRIYFSMKNRHRQICWFSLSWFDHFVW